MRDAELGPALEALWKKNYSVYGRRKLTKAAQRAGLDVGRDQVARLMRPPGHPGRQPGQEALHDQGRRDARARTGPREAKLHRQRDPTQLWVADFTYCSTWSGIVYVAFIIDVFSRRLVGWKAAAR